MGKEYTGSGDRINDASQKTRTGEFNFPVGDGGGERCFVRFVNFNVVIVARLQVGRIKVKDAIASGLPFVRKFNCTIF